MLAPNIQKKLKNLNIHSSFRKNFKVVIYPGDCLNHFEPNKNNELLNFKTCFLAF